MLKNSGQKQLNSRTTLGITLPMFCHVHVFLPISVSKMPAFMYEISQGMV